MSLDAGIWGGDDNPAAILVTEVIRSGCRYSKDSESQRAKKWQSNSLQDRNQQEILASGGVAISPSLMRVGEID